MTVASASMVDGKVADTHIKCELCGSEYEKRVGSTNDCPTCNTPGGKNPSAADLQALRDAAGPLLPAIDGMTRSMAQLSGRIAAIEQEVAALKAKLAE